MTRQQHSSNHGGLKGAVGWRLRAAWLALLLALLCLQSLGLAHRYAHGSVSAGAHGTHLQRVSQSDLLPSHDQAVCQLLDQLCVGDAAPTTLTVLLPLPPTPGGRPWPAQGVQASEPVPFQARAPPAAVG